MPQLIRVEAFFYQRRDMDKREIQAFTRAILPILKKAVRTEVKKVMKPILKEMVEGEVNKILAEQFLSHLSQPRTNLVEVMQAEKGNDPSETKRSEKRSRQMAESRRSELLKKLGADSDPGLAMIYDDIVTESVSAGPGSGMGTYDDPLEGDDEGVDLSHFGL